MIRTLVLLAALGQQPAPAPPLWQLADINGQVWQHADRDHLSRWVAGRNSMLAASRAPSPFVPRRFDPPFGMWRTAPAVRYFRMVGGYSYGCRGGACEQ